MFDPPFYRIFVENYFNGNYEGAKLTLDTSEPSNSFVDKLITRHWDMFEFHHRSASDVKISHKKINPKRLQRMSRKEVKKGIGTKAQNALKEQNQLKKKKGKKKKRVYIREKKLQKFEIKQHKKMEKHKGH